MRIRLEHLAADVLGLSDIGRAALGGRPRPPDLPGMVVPDRAADVPRPDERFDTDDRRDLVEVLRRELAPYRPHVAVLDALRDLERPGTAVVVTGQQPGFLGGPLYDTWKALHAVRVARALAEAWGAAVVPVFWNHSDDHDVTEVHHLDLLNEHLDLRRVGLAGVSAGRLPISELVLDVEKHGIGAIGELLRQLLAEGPHRDEAIDLVLPRQGESLAQAFTRTLLGLLGRHGLLVLEPRWLRPRLARALARIVERHPIEALAAGAEALSTAGHEVAIDPRSAALVFHHGEDGRQPLRAGGDGFRYDGESGSRNADELAAEIVQQPQSWSAGALLRPVVQDLALPVAAYVGGFGELAYHAELPPLREAVGAPRTPFVPRLSCTLVEPETRRSLERLELDVAAVLRARGDIGAALGDEGGGLVPEVATRLREVGELVAERIRSLREPLSELDRGLAVQAKKTAEQARALVEKLAGKAERVHANRMGKGRRHHRRVASTLVPRGEPQERVLGVLPFAARYGTDFLDGILADVEAFPSEHVVVHLEEEET